MAKFLSLLVSGGVTGVIFSILAMGLVLTYSTTGIFNFAHGAIAFVTAYVFYELNTGLHWPIVPSAIVAVGVFAPLLGLALDALLFRALTQRSETTKIVGTVGLLVALPAAFSFVIERLIKTFHFGLRTNEVAFQVAGIGPSPRHVWHPLHGVSFDSDQLVIILASAAAAAALWFVVTRTRVGLEMRAAVDAPSLSALRGVDPVRTSRVAWVLGCVLAGLAGVVAAPNSAFGLNPNNYTLVLLVAATAAIFARLRSLPLAFLGGVLLGVVRNLVQGYLTWGGSIPGLRGSTPFWLLFGALYFLGKQRGRRTGSVSAEVPPPDYLADLPTWRRRLPWAIALVLLVVYTLGPADSIWRGIVLRGLGMAVIFLSFTVVTGLGGMVSLAQATFVAAGGMTTGLLMSHGWPFLPALLVGGLSAVVLGLVVALPSLRLGGLPLALSTLALAFIGDQVLFQINSYRNYAEGWPVPRPSFLGIDFSGDAAMAMLVLGVVLVVSRLILNLQRSATGRSVVAVRTAQDAAAASGLSHVSVKLALFGVSAFIAGIGGGLYASIDGRITNFTWPPLVGLVWLAVTVTFGVRRPVGAIVAGMAFFVSPRIFNAGFHFPSWVPSFLSWNGTTSVLIPSILFGLGAIGLAKDPDGVIAKVAEQAHGRRRRRRADAEARHLAALAAEAEASAVAEVHQVADALAASGVVHRAAEAAVEAGTPRLQVRTVGASYGEVDVLHGVDLELHPGRITALLGANGGGKSTLCNLIAGTLAPTTGTIVLDGADITSLPAHVRAGRGVMLAPESRGVFPGLTVDENLRVWLRTADERARAYERFPHLAERRQLVAGSLSGGEQQMLTMAPVVVRPPEVLVADEPTLGLAPLVADELMAVFRDLAATGVSLLLVEEKSRHVLGIADNVAFLHLGHIVWSGPRASVDDDELAALYLGAGAVS